MLRLAHRILSTPPYLGPGVPDWWAEIVRQQISKSTVVIGDNVAEYAFSTWKTGVGIEFNFEDAPCVKPPIEPMFVEYGLPKCVIDLHKGHESRHCQSQHGMLVFMVQPDDLPPEVASQIGTFHNIVAAFPCAGFADGTASIMGLQFYFGCDDKWAVQKVAKVCHPEVANFPSLLFFPSLLTVAFMHCKNVVRTDATETEGPPAKWLRRMKQPTLRYHVLEINPMKEVLRKEGGSETNGLKKALHICRGHFATYTEEKPLFGRISGTVWKPAHVRGSKEFGEVKKDYAVNAPKEPPCPTS